MSGDFSPDQKRYLEGFVSGLTAARVTRAKRCGRRGSASSGPDAMHFKAQDRVIAEGGKLTDQEKIKREEHPFDAYAAPARASGSQRTAEAGRQFPLALLRPVLRRADAELLHVPAADRERHPQALAVLRALPMWRSATAAHYSHVTTRANLQIREIEPKNATAVVEAIQDLGLCSRGSGADNIRNVTGTPTAGIDPQELLDTRPYAREWHFHILNDRALYGLPRKFNVAFDGAGIIPVLEDTNDIALPGGRGDGRVRRRAGRLVPPRARRHHRSPDFARDTGVIVRAGRCDEGGGRDRARLHRAWRPHRPQQGAAEIRARRLGLREVPRRGRGEARHASSMRVPPEAVAPRPAFDRSAHIGVHAQKQAGLNWIGVVLTARQDVGRADARAGAHFAPNSATAISASRSGRIC